MPEVVIALALVVAGAAYALAVRHVWTIRVGDISWLEATAFIAGVAVLAVALVSPIDGAADRHLSIHMIQHVLLVSVAAPLLVVGRPLHLVAILGGWDMDGRVVPPSRAWPILVVAALVQVGVLLVWHLPVLYDAALNADPVHGLEHLTLLASAFVLWFALAEVGGEPPAPPWWPCSSPPFPPWRSASP